MSNWIAKGEELKGIMQTLLEIKRLCGSLRSGAEALLPLAADDQTKSQIQVVLDAGEQARAMADHLYQKDAGEAFRS